MASFLESLDPTGLVSGGLSFLGGFMRNESQEAQASAQMAFQREMSNTAYQRQVSDLKSAGINPMLAAKLGGASTPQGAQAQIQDAVSPAVQAYQAQRMNSAQVANVEADTKNKAAQSELIRAQAAQAWSSAWQNQASTELVNQQVKDITQKLENRYWDSETDRIVALANQLRHSADLLAEQGLTEPQRRNQLAAIVLKLAEETDLLKLDVQAAKAFENLGREYKQIEPIVELIKFFSRRK
jgi:hypothetical protein